MKSLPDFLSFDASADRIGETDVFNPGYKPPWHDIPAHLHEELWVGFS